jgi:hypothetical protein
MRDRIVQSLGRTLEMRKALLHSMSVDRFRLIGWLFFAVIFRATAAFEAGHEAPSGHLKNASLRGGAT